MRQRRLSRDELPETDDLPPEPHAQNAAYESAIVPPTPPGRASSAGYAIDTSANGKKSR